MTRHFRETIQLLEDHHSHLEGLLPTLEADAESLEKALSHFEFGQLSGPLRSVQGSLDEALKLLKRLVTLNELRGELEALQALSHDLAPLLPAAEAVPLEITNCQTEGLKAFTTAARSVGAKVDAVLSELDRIA